VPPPFPARTQQQDWVDGATLVEILKSEERYMELQGPYSGPLQTNTEGSWLDSPKLLGTSGWFSYNFLFFDPEGILYSFSSTASFL